MITFNRHNWDGGAPLKYTLPESFISEFMQYILTDSHWPHMRQPEEMELFFERILRFRKKADSVKIAVTPEMKAEDIEEVVEELPPMALERGGDPVPPVKRGRGRPRKVAA